MLLQPAERRKEYQFGIPGRASDPPIRLKLPSRPSCKKYIEECHQHGIHVTDYMSIGNMFWEDMFAHVPESRGWLLKINGEPVPYGTADYAVVGKVTRYLADLSLEAWQEYALARVTAAVDAGADGIMVGNSSSYYSRELLQQFTARALYEARKKNPQVLVSSNYGRDEWLLQSAASDKVVLSVSVYAVSTSQRVHTRQLASFLVPANGTTTSFTFVGHL
jgi:hypothetical protein